MNNKAKVNLNYYIAYYSGYYFSMCSNNTSSLGFYFNGNSFFAQFLHSTLS